MICNSCVIYKRLFRVDQVAAWRMCMGCGACAWACPQNAILMIDKTDTGIRPVIDKSKCQECGACLDVCPGIALEHVGFPADCIEELKTGWGPVLEIIEGYAVDPEIRFKASSGGAATAIALWAIEKGGFSGVLHIRADPNDPVRCIPSFTRNREDLMQTLGSRYAPAAPCGAFDMIKQAESPCVFVGKPCDCAAIRKACRLDPELSVKVGLVVSIFCAGTPTTAGTLAVIKEMGIDNPETITSFRYRGYGWPGQTAAITRSENSEEYSYKMTYEKAWGEILVKYGQLRCRLCPDKTGEFSDISVGDPWYRDTKDDIGRSLILIRSINGLDIWRNIDSSGLIESYPVESNKLPESQKSLFHSRCSLKGRLTAFKVIGLPVPVYKGFSLDENWKTLALKEKIKTILGTIRRIFRRKWFLKDKDLFKIVETDVLNKKRFGK